MILGRPGSSPGARATAPETFKNQCVRIGKHGFWPAPAPLPGGARDGPRNLQKPLCSNRKTWFFARPGSSLGARATALDTFKNHSFLIGKHGFWSPQLLIGGARDGPRNLQKPLFSNRKTWCVAAPAPLRGRARRPQKPSNTIAFEWENMVF